MKMKEEYRLSDKRLPGLNPVTFGKEACSRGFAVDVIRPYWLLHYVTAGKGTLKVDNRVYNVGPSQLFIVHPHEAHCYTADMQEPWQYMWVAFEIDVPMPAILENSVITAPIAGRLFTDCMNAAQMRSGREEYLSGKLWELVSLFLRMESDGNKGNPYVTLAKEYIEERYMHGIKITDIAKHVNLDRSYFSTIFKAETGISPQEYLSKCRLEQAAELLMQGEMAVTAIADAVGYNDIVNFSRMFKKHFGVPPSRYKEYLLAHSKE